ncbi:MAG: pyridoxamine 5'-phosphate oxidase family protein [Candidatus Omnitrophica bacterium]|nr:pyridoxamine 5'-phosphate oxidase family protein [Candidatus Omnitrophota bacterium]
MIDRKLFTKEIMDFLRRQVFLFIGTSDKRGRPHTSAKPLLKIEDNYIYLVDFVVGRTYKNIKRNPKISLSAVDMNKVIGYQLYGRAEVIDKGDVFRQLSGEMNSKQVRLATERVIQGVRKSTRSLVDELISLKTVSILKIRIKEVSQIKPSGDITRDIVQ